MNGPVQVFTAIALISLPTVMFGGFSLLRLLVARRLNEFQVAYFRAGHAHAGVLLVLTLVVLDLLTHTSLVPDWAVDRRDVAPGRGPGAVRRHVRSHGHWQARAMVGRKHADQRRRRAPGRSAADYRGCGHRKLTALCSSGSPGLHARGMYGLALKGRSGMRVHSPIAEEYHCAARGEREGLRWRRVRATAGWFPV